MSSIVQLFLVLLQTFILSLWIALWDATIGIIFISAFRPLDSLIFSWLPFPSLLRFSRVWIMFPFSFNSSFMSLILFSVIFFFARNTSSLSCILSLMFSIFSSFSLRISWNFSNVLYLNSYCWPAPVCCWVVVIVCVVVMLICAYATLRSRIVARRNVISFFIRLISCFFI